VKKAELRLITYIVEQYLSFLAIEHLPHLIQAVGNDINVVNAIKTDRTKCGAIINNVFGTCSFNFLVKELQKSQFSLTIDESTDIGSIKHLALVVRVQEEDNKTVDKFLHLLPISLPIFLYIITYIRWTNFYICYLYQMELQKSCVIEYNKYNRIK